MHPGSSPTRLVYVTNPAEAAELDKRTIERGIPSLELMRRAGTAVAEAIEREVGARLHNGLCIFTGPGNNGGDGWIVAACLARHGIRARVVEAAPAKSADAQAARAAAIEHVELVDGAKDEAVIIDALLGTGATGSPRGELARAVEQIGTARAVGAYVVAIDLPTGVDGTTGESDAAVTADLTVTFGTVKRGHLVARDRCGKIVVAEIGLVEPREASKLPTLITPEWTYALVPPIPVAAHKGSRGGISVIGGGPGMAGAAMLAGRGALRSGVGSSRICVWDENVASVHTAVPPALVTPWSKVLERPDKYLGDWPEAIAIGPGLGTEGDAPELLDQMLAHWRGPFIADADALNLLVGRLDEFRERVHPGDSECRAVLTPHMAEMKRLLGGAATVREVIRTRYEASVELARRTGAVVVLKGVPTVIAAPDGVRRVSAAGTPALATGGSGDVLTGVIVTLLAQGVRVFDAASIGAWMHGRAAELATGDRTARGVTIEDVVDCLKDAWVTPPPHMPVGVLAELPAIR